MSIGIHGNTVISSHSAESRTDLPPGLYYVFPVDSGKVMTVASGAEPVQETTGGTAGHNPKEASQTLKEGQETSSFESARTEIAHLLDLVHYYETRADAFVIKHQTQTIQGLTTTLRETQRQLSEIQVEYQQACAQSKQQQDAFLHKDKCIAELEESLCQLRARDERLTKQLYRLAESSSGC